MCVKEGLTYEDMQANLKVEERKLKYPKIPLALWCAHVFFLLGPEDSYCQRSNKF